MKKLVLLFGTLMPLRGAAQQSAALRAAAEADWKSMLDSLHITALRPGADGSHPGAPNAVNYNEAKANPYPDLPDPLRLNNGKRVGRAAQWWKERRPEIVDAFDSQVYGRVPAHIPPVRWEVVSKSNDTASHIPVLTKHLLGHVGDSVTIQLTLVTPAQARGPVPVMMELSFPPGKGKDTSTALSWQAQVLARGWGYVLLLPTSIQADNGAGLTGGIIGLMDHGGHRKPDDWGALRAWAWGASRVMDYLETDPAVDARQVGIEGHSRYGKAALVTMAYDNRFAIAYISSSGEGGAKLHRRNYGEIVENLAASGEYHWVAGNFLRYAGPLHWNDLPVDAHELIALCAPRPVFIGGGANGDNWADPRGMFMAAAAASPVYELLGAKGLGTAVFPPAGTALIGGDLGFRQHLEGHTPLPNWPAFIEFASKYLKVKE